MAAPATVTLAGLVWVLPFKAHGFWVNDARGQAYCKCKSPELAKVTAGILIKEFSPVMSAQQRAINTIKALRGY